MTASPKKTAFVSHSHNDNDIAEALARTLAENGVKAWLDKWEIQPGDSLVQKIFEEGLSGCQIFIILLSPDSIQSPWVKHELDSAIVQRLQGATKVVPVIAKPCDVPVSLRPLMRLDMSEGVDVVAKKLADAAYGRSQRPKVTPQPSTITIDVPGLTRNAAHLAAFLAKSMDQPDGRSRAYSGPALAEGLKVDAENVNEAVDELESLGLVRTHKWMGTAPYEFGQVEPTPQLALELRGTGILDYDPEEDIKAVAAAIGHCKKADGQMLAKETKLPASRINRAVSYLEDYGIARVIKTLGTAPYTFREVWETPATQRFIKENCK